MTDKSSDWEPPPPPDPQTRVGQAQPDGLAPRYQKLAGFLSGLLFIGAAIVGVTGLVVPINQATQKAAEVEVVLPKKAMNQLLDGYEAPEDVGASLDQIPGGSTFLLEIGAVPRYESFLSEAGKGVFLLSVAGICFLLAQMLRDIRYRRTFTKMNQRRIYLIAALVATGTYGAAMVSSLAADTLFNHFGEPLSDYVRPAPFEPGLGPLLAIGVIVVFGEVFRQGRSLAKRSNHSAV